MNAPDITAPATERATLDADEVAALIGCSAAHVRRLAARGEFPKPLRLGTRVMWSRALVLAFVNGAPILTAAVR
jgi:predicted DNA-binding transcriptional regulator AlpA